MNKRQWQTLAAGLAATVDAFNVTTAHAPGWAAFALATGAAVHRGRTRGGG